MIPCNATITIDGVDFICSLPAHPDYIDHEPDATVAAEWLYRHYVGSEWHGWAMPEGGPVHV